MTNDPLFQEFSKHFTVGGSKPRVTRTAADRRRYRQAPDSALVTWSTPSPRGVAPDPTVARRAKAELKRRYGNKTPAEFWADLGITH